MKRYIVTVTAKKGIFDPAGAQAKNGLDNLGLPVEAIKIGKHIEVDMPDGSTADDVALRCDKLLANPVIEDYRIEEVA